MALNNRLQPVELCGWKPCGFNSWWDKKKKSKDIS